MSSQARFCRNKARVASTNSGGPSALARASSKATYSRRKRFAARQRKSPSAVMTAVANLVSVQAGGMPAGTGGPFCNAEKRGCRIASTKAGTAAVASRSPNARAATPPSRRW